MYNTTWFRFKLCFSIQFSEADWLRVWCNLSPPLSSRKVVHFGCSGHLNRVLGELTIDNQTEPAKMTMRFIANDPEKRPFWVIYADYDECSVVYRCFRSVFLLHRSTLYTLQMLLHSKHLMKFFNEEFRMFYKQLKRRDVSSLALEGLA